MACNISKQINGSSNYSGSSVKSVFSFGFVAIGFSGSGLTYTYNAENGNAAAAEYSPNLKSDISEQL